MRTIFPLNKKIYILELKNVVLRVILSKYIIDALPKQSTIKEKYLYEMFIANLSHVVDLIQNKTRVMLFQTSKYI